MGGKLFIASGEIMTVIYEYSIVMSTGRRYAKKIVSCNAEV